MPKNHPAYNRKIKTSSLSLPIHQSTYAQKKIYLLTFSADLQALCTPATKLFLNTSSLIQRNKIKSLSEYAFNFLHISYKQTKNPLTYTQEFRGTLTTKILTFYKSFTNEERTPLTFYADSEAL